MKFEFTPTRVRETRDGTRFRIGRLMATGRAGVEDLTHLVDRAYDYASARELRWHLAERFALPVTAVSLARH